MQNENIVQNEGESALQYTSIKGEDSTLSLLLSQDAEGNLANLLVISTQYEGTALDSVGESEQIDCVSSLIGIRSDLREKEIGLTGIGVMEEMAEEEELQMSENPVLLHTFGRGGNPTQNTVESIVQKDFQLKPLYDWLWKINLPMVYDLLVDAGFNDIADLRNRMLGQDPITETELIHLGIDKPGHRKKILLKLLEDAALAPKRGFKKTTNKNLMKCCIAPSNATTAFNFSVVDWLDTMDLGFLIGKFEETGYDDYECLVCLMMTDMQLTTDTLAREVGIRDKNICETIVSRLKDDAKQLISESGNPMFDEPKSVACGMCAIM